MSIGSIRKMTKMVLLALAMAVAMALVMVVVPKEAMAANAPIKNTNPQCTVYANNPHFSGHVAGRINGEGEVRCGSRWNKVSIIVRLQRYTGGKWRTVGTEGASSRTDASYHHDFSNRACDGGRQYKYRTWVVGSVTTRGGTTRGKNVVSATRTLACG